MSMFEDVLNAGSEDLLKIFYRSTLNGDPGGTQRTFAGRLGLRRAQLVCAMGFNPLVKQLTDALAVAGFNSYDALAQERNEVFTQDVYSDLRIKNILAIYTRVSQDLSLIEIMQHLMKVRLSNIEDRIDATVDTNIIERYKKEVRTIYSEGVAQIDFVEHRLSQTDSGFRALLDEVGLIIANRLIPIGDIFFRRTVLPEEKRRLISKGHVPRELIETRMNDANLMEDERQMLERQIRYL